MKKLLIAAFLLLSACDGTYSSHVWTRTKDATGQEWIGQTCHVIVPRATLPGGERLDDVWVVCEDWTTPPQ